MLPVAQAMATLAGDSGDVSLMTPQPPQSQVSQGSPVSLQMRSRADGAFPQRRSIAMSDHTAQPDGKKPLRGAKGTTDGYPEVPGFLSRRSVLRAFGAGAAV